MTMSTQERITGAAPTDAVCSRFCRLRDGTHYHGRALDRCRNMLVGIADAPLSCEESLAAALTWRGLSEAGEIVFGGEGVGVAGGQDPVHVGQKLSVQAHRARQVTALAGPKRRMLSYVSIRLLARHDGHDRRRAERRL
jgi:hypothetical protein